MAKIDLKKELKSLYNAPKEPVLVDVPDMAYLMVDGTGDPATSPEYMAAMEALFPVAYTLKFAVKKTQGIDYAVMPLEGLWWADDMSRFMESRDSWKWTSMIMQPDYVTPELFKDAVEQVRKKKAPSSIDKVRFEGYSEGLSAQVMHTGPYSEEGPTVAKLHGFIETKGYARAGKHHEIYLSDPRKGKPEKMKTIIRQPVRKM